jgi:predicted KAP-like P-loop ATPase
VARSAAASLSPSVVVKHLPEGRAGGDSARRDMQTTPVIEADRPQTDPANDRFRRLPFARSIANIISTRSDPESLVIGVTGVWGEGKTTVLHFIASELRARGITVLWFNPWRFGSDDALLRTFFFALTKAIEKNIGSARKIVGKLLRDYVSAVVPPVTVELSEPSGTRTSVKLHPGEAAKNLGEKMLTDDIEELKAKVEKALRDRRIRIVVLMDDIDRLDNDEVMSLFRLVKLSADFPYVTYVLAYDEPTVASALALKYGGGKTQDGERFLEKIIQLPLPIPKAPEGALRAYWSELMDPITESLGVQLNELEKGKLIFQLGNLEAGLQTPRGAKRYANAAAFSLPMLYGEVNTVDVLLLDGIRILFPTVFDAIRTNPEAFVGSMRVDVLEGVQAGLENMGPAQERKQRTEELLADATAGLGAAGAHYVRELLAFLFPRIAGRTDPSAEKYQHVSVRKYFYRYLNYTVPSGDVADRQLQAFLAGASELPAEELDDQVKELIDRAGAENLVWELKKRLADVTARSAGKVALALARRGPDYPRTHFIGPSQLASRLIAQLIGMISNKAERFATIQTIVRDVSPVAFAAECHRAVTSEDAKSALSVHGQRRLNKCLSDRIRCLIHKESISGLNPMDVPLLLALWSQWGSRHETDAYLKGTFKDGKAAVELLKLYFHGSYRFAGESFENLKRVVSPDAVYKAIRKVYGSRLKQLRDCQEITVSIMPLLGRIL